MNVAVLWDTLEIERKLEMFASTDCKFSNPEVMILVALSPLTATQGSSNLTSSHQATDLEEIASRDWNTRVKESMTIT